MSTVLRSVADHLLCLKKIPEPILSISGQDNYVLRKTSLCLRLVRVASAGLTESNYVFNFFYCHVVG